MKSMIYVISIFLSKANNVMPQTHWCPYLCIEHVKHLVSIKNVYKN